MHLAIHVSRHMTPDLFSSLMQNIMDTLFLDIVSHNPTIASVPTIGYKQKTGPEKNH